MGASTQAISQGGESGTMLQIQSLQIGQVPDLIRNKTDSLEAETQVLQFPQIEDLSGEATTGIIWKYGRHKKTSDSAVRGKTGEFSPDDLLSNLGNSANNFSLTEGIAILS